MVGAVVRRDRTKTFHVQLASGGCNGGKKGDKESQTQNQSHEQKAHNR